MGGHGKEKTKRKIKEEANKARAARDAISRRQSASFFVNLVLF